MNRYVMAIFLMAVIAQGASAQSGTKSPYSQFGLGLQTDQSSSFNRGMDGLGIGFHERNQVNSLNPAAYSAIDSLSFIFDAGISGQLSNYTERNKKLNAKTANVEYIVAGFRLARHLGLSFGLLPYTNVGYSYTVSQQLDDANKTTATNTYEGHGGLRQVYLGLAWEIFRGLSIGVNGSYLFGDYTKTMLSAYSDGYANVLTQKYTADVRNYKLDFGVQYTANLSKKDALTLGMVYGLGHRIGGNPKKELIATNSQTGVADTATYQGSDGNKLYLEIPHSFGVGLMYNHNSVFKLGFDYRLQQWGRVSSPITQVGKDNLTTYTMQTGAYKDRHKMTVGIELCPETSSRNLAKSMRYRIGASYATPYYYINGQDGPKEISASIGVGIPVVNGYNNRSILNVSFQWAQQAANNYIKDNTYRINIGFTFNERWFAKWKVD